MNLVGLQLHLGVKADNVFGPITLAAIVKALGLTETKKQSFSSRTEENLSEIREKPLAEFRRLLELADNVTPDSVTIEVISGHRSYEEQNELYEQGRRRSGKIVTKARGGYSWHNFGLAIDLGLFQNGLYLDEKIPMFADELYRKIAAEVKSKGLKITWGGNWKSFPDYPHFQFHTGLSKKDLREMSESRKLEILGQKQK